MTLSLSRLRRVLLPQPTDRFTDQPLIRQLRERFAQDLQPSQMRDAAVLVPLIERPHGWQVVLTRRSDQLKNHAGQISFPGGSAEVHDDNAAATAIREAQEEIGLDPEQVEVAGYLAEHAVISGFSVTPVIAVLGEQASYQADLEEVAEVFEVPWSFLLEPDNQLLETRRFRNVSRQLYRFQYGQYNIWGATAGMLVDLIETYQQSR